MDVERNDRFGQPLNFADAILLDAAAIATMHGEDLAIGSGRARRETFPLRTSDARRLKGIENSYISFIRTATVV
jgi:hypothetical protein